jgi:hypothetical protein
VTQVIARRFAGDRERAAATFDREARARLGVRDLAGWSAPERRAWQRWSPLVALLPGVARWSRSERAAAVRVIRAKGGVREDAFARAFDAHPRLAAAVEALLRTTRA